MIKVICYGKEKLWEDRNEAIRFYSAGVVECDGAERDRYIKIVLDLTEGENVCRDN